MSSCTWSRWTRPQARTGSSADCSGAKPRRFRNTPSQLIEWVSRRPSSRGYYAAQFRHVFGRSLEDAWSEWVRDEHEFQRRNLEQVRQYPLTPYRDITTRALGSVSRAHYDASTGSIYAGVNYPGAVAHIGRISTKDGSVQRLM